MKPVLKIEEEIDGFTFIRVDTNKGSYKFWVLPSKSPDKEPRLCYEIDAGIKAKGETKLKTGGQ